MTSVSHLFATGTVTASLALAFVACGSAPPPPAKADEGVPLAANTAAPLPDKPKAETPAPATSASAAASAAPEKKKPPAATGAPMAVTEDDVAVTTTYGARGGKIRVAGGIELTVPVDAVDVGTNFLLALNTGKEALKVTPYKGQIGDLFRMGVNRPDTAPSAITSMNGPFVLRVPMPKGTATANLVIAVPAGGKTGKYSVLAPKRIEEGDRPFAVFELSKIVPEAMIHLTSSPPTGGE
jgi:hypothetical protein